MNRNNLINLWGRIKNTGESIGIVFIILGFLTALCAWYFSVNDLLGISLGLISVGLGFVAIGMAAKLEEDVASLPTLFKNDTLTIAGQQLAEKVLIKQGKRRYKDIATRFILITEEQSKEEAQKRLDADIKKVGYIRGELYKRDDGSWAIHWGGAHPL